MAGKLIFSIPIDSRDQFDQVIEDGLAKIAKQVGFRFVDYTNSGQVSQYVAGMNLAISEHASLIDLSAGLNPADIAPQIAQAKAAGIPVVSSDAYGLTQESPPILSGTVKVPYAEAAQLQADWITVQSKGKGDTLIISSNDVPASSYGVAAMENEFKKACPECKSDTINIPVSQWATETQTQVAAFLVAHPNVDYIAPVYDSQSQYIIPAIQTSGRVGKVKIVTYDGTPFVLRYIQVQHGQIVQMDVGESLDWVSHAVMDAEMRIVGGLTPVLDEHLALYIWDAQNVDNAGIPPVASTGYGSAYIKGYDSLWGVSPS
jgi:ribose transport system substrate-binding protein